MTTSDIRRKRLKEWFSEKSLPEKEKSYLSQLINGRSSFGERAARRLEKDYGMPAGYLDADDENSAAKLAALELSTEEEELIKYFRGFPDSAKREALKDFESKYNKFNELFKELLASRK
ncbi:MULTISPECIES: hypothetical protein [Raoultella]|jgi:transcriptional regulator with XRE-family HTH domain|uniref:hypothetical protein n=1 Tax=Raoultella TaxID=160674 RepID=UPI0011683D6E|nr:MULTISPECIES: hypothetical protein [Raoultella]GEC68949.1 hypothetical protein RTE01_35840 [Raoultella terrigena]